MLEDCPNCGAILNFEELDWGCFFCGWIEGKPLDEDEELEDEDVSV